jgi:hypothetical protein
MQEANLTGSPGEPKRIYEDPSPTADRREPVRLEPIKPEPVKIEPAKVEQMEQALKILAAIVAHLAREVRAGKQRRAEMDRWELERSEMTRWEMVKNPEPDVQTLELLESIRTSLAQLRRRTRPDPARQNPPPEAPTT